MKVKTVKQDKPAIIQEGVIRKSPATNGPGAQIKGRIHNIHKQKSTTAKIGDDIAAITNITT